MEQDNPDIQGHFILFLGNEIYTERGRIFGISQPSGTHTGDSGEPLRLKKTPEI
jgi:hypothetical protein